MATMKLVKKIDTKNRVCVPNNWAKAGEFVCFEITSAGNLLLRKVKTDEPNKENALDEEDN